MRNDTNNSEINNWNVNEKRNNFLFSSYNGDPLINGELQESLETLRKSKDHESRMHSGVSKQEIFLSNQTENELANAFTGTINSEHVFEVFNVEQTYSVNKNIKKDLELRDNEPYHQNNYISKQHNEDRKEKSNNKDQTQFEQFNRRDSMGQPIRSSENNMVRIMNYENSKYDYPSHRLNPNCKGINIFY